MTPEIKMTGAKGSLGSLIAGLEAGPRGAASRKPATTKANPTSRVNRNIVLRIVYLLSSIRGNITLFPV
jgi:hypothetical protein